MKLFVTVILKQPKCVIWNKVLMCLQGDCSDLKNLQRQLELIKQDVNRDMNKREIHLREVDIFVDFLQGNSINIKGNNNSISM